MTNPILLIALHEFTINRRNKWVASFAGLFAILTFLIAYFGMVTSGYSGFQDFTRTSASIVNLSGFIIPLFALLLGVFSFITDKGYIELLVTQPISRSQVILGKYIGLVITIVATTLIGFGLPGVVISLVIGLEGAIVYAIVVGISILLSIVFVGLSILITLLSQRRQVALGAAIGVWLYFELFYGLLVLGSTLYFSHTTLKTLLLLALYGNPVDLTRVISLVTVAGPYFYGPAGATLIKMTGSTFGAGMWGSFGLIVWIVVPLFVSVRLFNRQNL